MFMGNGIITYYPKMNQFVAECHNHQGPGLPKCKRTRQANASAKAGSAQGRPLGFLAYFLLNCGGPEIKVPEDHYRFAAKYTKAQRQIGRATLKKAPGSAFFFSKERAKRLGEESEPDAMP